MNTMTRLPETTREWFPLALSAAVLTTLSMLVSGCGSAAAGPNGGEVIPSADGSVNAELLTNQETGEVMIQTWDEDLDQPKPIEAATLKIEANGNTVELAPHPTAADPSGLCSRFYGRADWLQSGEIHRGRLHGPHFGGGHAFDWDHGWDAGRKHGHMWSDMPGHGGHGRHGGKGGKGGHH